MKRYRINAKWSLMLLTVLAALQFTVTSCSDDDSAGGTPVITAVRVPDPAKADSTFTKAGPGSTIAIMGQNLGNTLKVFINGQQVYFNPTMNTDHSIIVQIPSETDGFKLSTFNSEIPDEIRVETSHGTATYAFKITAPSPQFQRIGARYPRNAGDTLRLYGLNLVDIEEIYITDIPAAQLDTTEWKEIGGNHVAITNYFDITKDHHLNPTTKSYETTSVVGAILPSSAPEKGTLVIECASGTVYMPYTRVPGQPVILGVSTDMPQIGETFYITGREFVQVESIRYGDVTLKEGEFITSESEDTIFVNFTKKPSVGSGTDLVVTTPGGTVKAERFYDYTTILTTFDGDATDNGWGPNATYADSGTADGIYAHINVPQESQQWWGTMVYFRKDWSGNSFALSGNIPETATADEVYLAMEVYNNNSSYNNGLFSGYIRYMIQPIGDAENTYDNQIDWENYDEGIPKFEFPILGSYEGEAPLCKWYRHVLPLNKFACYAGKTYKDIVATGLNQFRLQSINQATHSGTIDVKFDNVRVIYIPKK